MGEFLRKTTIVNLLFTVLLLGLGIVLVLNPTMTLSVISSATEIILIAAGIVNIINFIKVDSKDDVFSFGFVKGVVCILVSIFLIVNPTIIVTIFPICLGIWMVFGSLSQMQVAVKLTAWGHKTSLGYILLAVLMFTIGFIVLCNPFGAATLLVRVIGMGIIAYTMLDIISSIGVLRFLNKVDI